DDCWALRTGQARDGESAGTKCRHFASHPNAPFICLPLMAHGERSGLIYLNVGPARAIDGDTRRLLMLFGEVVKLSLSNLSMRETLRELATHDPLTGLFNRRYLDESLSRDLARARRARQPLCVAMLDIDRFKSFNDENGHEA